MRVLTSVWQQLRSSPPKLFLGKGVLKIRRNFTGEHPCRSVREHPCRSVVSVKQLYLNHSSAWVFSCKFFYIFPEDLFIRTPLEGCFESCKSLKQRSRNLIERRSFFVSFEKHMWFYRRIISWLFSDSLKTTRVYLHFSWFV